MKHIIDSEAVEKRLKEMKCDYSVQCFYLANEVISYNEGVENALIMLRALIANSPQADGMVVPSEPNNVAYYEVVDALIGMVWQYLEDANGFIDHSFMSAGENAECVLERLGIVKEGEIIDKFKDDGEVKSHIESMLSAYKPQADDYGQDFNLEYTCKRIRRLLNAMSMSDPSDGKDHVLMGMLFTLLGTICSKLEKPQADDVRKDAERYRWLCMQQDNSNIFIMGKYASKDGSYGDFSGQKLDIDQAIDKARE